MAKHKQSLYSQLLDIAIAHVPCKCPMDECKCECILWKRAPIIRTDDLGTKQRHNRLMFAAVHNREYELIGQIFNLCGDVRCMRPSHYHETVDKLPWQATAKPITCKMCGNDFYSYRKDIAFLCSKKCKNRHSVIKHAATRKINCERFRKNPKNMITRDCAWCKKPYSRYKNNIKQTCSISCGQSLRYHPKE